MGSQTPEEASSSGSAAAYVCVWNTLFMIFHSPSLFSSVKKSVYLSPVQCSLDNRVMFELTHGVGDAFKANAELYAPDGYFVKCTDAPEPELFDLTGSAIQVGGITMFGNIF